MTRAANFARVARCCGSCAAIIRYDGDVRTCAIHEQPVREYWICGSYRLHDALIDDVVSRKVSRPATQFCQACELDALRSSTKHACGLSND